jgi:hypothetical protein
VQHLQGHVLALGGRGGDTRIAHVTPGEFVIPPRMLTPDVLNDLYRAARVQGIDPATLQVGSGRNSVNPRTGQIEFDDNGLGNPNRQSQNDDQDAGAGRTAAPPFPNGAAIPMVPPSAPTTQPIDRGPYSLLGPPVGNAIMTAQQSSQETPSIPDWMRRYGPIVEVPGDMDVDPGFTRSRSSLLKPSERDCDIDIDAVNTRIANYEADVRRLSSLQNALGGTTDQARRSAIQQQIDQTNDRVNAARSDYQHDVAMRNRCSV